MPRAHASMVGGSWKTHCKARGDGGLDDGGGTGVEKMNKPTGGCLGQITGNTGGTKESSQAETSTGITTGYGFNRFQVLSIISVSYGMTSLAYLLLGMGWHCLSLDYFLLQCMAEVASSGLGHLLVKWTSPIFVPKKHCISYLFSFSKESGKNTVSQAFLAVCFHSQSD